MEEAYRVTPSSLPNLPQDRDVEEEASQMVREVGAGRGAPSPVAQYHNGHLVNRVDIGGQQRWEENRLVDGCLLGRRFRGQPRARA